VAAGLSPLELGGDVGGSARIPAHFCGTFGLKPTQHRVSTRGHIPDLPGALRASTQMLQPGPLARSAEDLALALRVIAGPDSQRPAVPPVPFDAPGSLELAGCRIGWCNGFGGVPVSADTTAVLERTAADLAAAGCRVDRTMPTGVDWDDVWSTWGELVQPEITTSMPAVMRAVVRALGLLSARQSSMNRGWLRGGSRDRRRYFRALERRDAFAAALDRFLDSYDAWLLPTVVVPAFPHAKSGAPIPVDDHRVPYMLAGSAFTCIASLTGHPAVSVPGALSAEGLPIGLQLIGRRWDDLRLVATAGLLAGLTGGFRRPPGY